MRLKRTIKAYRKYGYHEIWRKIGGVYAILDCAVTQLRLGTTPEEYISLEFWRKSNREKAKYISYRIDQTIYHYVKSHVTAEQFWRIGDKLQFNRFFGDFIHRDYLNAAEVDEASVRAFIEKHGVILAKRVSQTQGKGILRIAKEDIDSELLKKLISEGYLLEERIVQHHALASINDSSVNTIRVGTAIDSQNHARIIGACLRCGAPGSYVDNFHAGGIAFPIDTDLGVVINRGITNTSLDHPAVHPGSGVQMIGFSIPNWKELTDLVIKASEMVPEMLFLGWDIAVTEDGVEFIEANIGADSTVLELDHKGKLDMIRRILPIRL